MDSTRFRLHTAYLISHTPAGKHLGFLLIFCWLWSAWCRNRNMSVNISGRQATSIQQYRKKERLSSTGKGLNNPRTRTANKWYKMQIYYVWDKFYMTRVKVHKGHTSSNWVCDHACVSQVFVYKVPCHGRNELSLLYSHCYIGDFNVHRLADSVFILEVVSQ